MKVLRWVGSVALLALWGCGGGSKSIVADQVMAPGLAETAAFHVDVATGKVTVTSQAGSASRAVFAGTAVGMTSSLLLDQTGNTGRKVLRVSLTNRTGEPIGQMPNGLVTGVRVTFSDIVAPLRPTELRSQTVVGTVAGMGALGPAVADGPVGQVGIAAPYGLAVGDGGALYFAEHTRHRIRKISGGLITTVAGSDTAGGADGTGAAATLNFPAGIAYNAAEHALIVAEMGGNSIRRIDASGRVTHIAGTGALGDADGPGSTATFRNPAGVAVDASGTIYVAEYTGNRIRRIVRTGGDPSSAGSYTVSLLAGTSASLAFYFADGTGAAARFLHPEGVAVDDRGNVYVADRSNHRIRRISAGGNVITIAGTGTAGSVDGSGSDATLREPYGVAWVDGALMVSDVTGQVIRQVRSVDAKDPSPVAPSGWVVQTLAGLSDSAGYADGGGIAARFASPAYIAAAGNGQLLIADVSNRRIRSLAPQSGFFPITVPTSVGAPDATPVRLWNADGEAAASNRQYIRYPGSLPSGASSAAQAWEFVVPSGVQSFEFTVTVEADTAYGAQAQGTVGAGSRDMVVATDAGLPGVAGQRDGPGNQALFADPTDVACDRDGIVYVVDLRTGVIRRIDREHVVTTIAGNGVPSAEPQMDYRLLGPTGIAVAPDGKTLFLCDDLTRICRISLVGSDPALSTSWSVRRIAGSLVDHGWRDGSGDGALLTGAMRCALGPSGTDVYVTEYSGNRVRRLRWVGGDPNLPDNWMVSTVAGDTDGKTPAGAYANGPGEVARFDSPKGIAVSASGVLYIADEGNHCIRRIGADGMVTLFAGQAGTSGYIDATGAAACFHSPAGVACDRSGYVYVADEALCNVRRISTGGIVTTVAGAAAIGFYTDGTGDVAGFMTPNGICVDPSGTVHVADTGSNRVRSIQRSVQPSGP